jgi:hypothetical protein
MKPGAGPDELLGILCIALGVVLLVVYTIRIFYCLTMQKALSRVAPQNRTMEPGMVWLYLIPCVDIIWLFMIAIRVPESLGNEFRARGRDDGSDYGKSTALASAVVSLLSGVVSYGMRFASGGGAGGGGHGRLRVGNSRFDRSRVVHRLLGKGRQLQQPVGQQR